MNIGSNLLAQIERQRKLSDQITSLVLQALLDIYYPHQPQEQVGCGDIGSYARGTNSDLIPDIDIMFLGIPTDAAQGYTDWTGKGTFEISKN